VLQLQAVHAVLGGQRQAVELVGHAQGDPRIPAAAQGGGRAAVVGDAAVAAANDQELEELSNTTRSGLRGRWQPSGWLSWRVGSSAVNWSQRGSWMQDGIAGTRPPRDHLV
jgi:hypothetical protein